jgi:hypothetical protein
MRGILVPVIILSSSVVATARGQVDYYARLVLSYATALVQDDILQQIEVRQSLAPTLALGAATGIAPRYRAGLEGTLTSGGFHSEESGSDTDLGTIRTGTLLLGLDGPIWQRFRWRAGAGLITYWPAEDSGIFLRGGTSRFLAGAGVDYRYPTQQLWDVMVSLRYDFHRFTTDELVARGFSGSQGVQRISLSVGLARRGL